MLQKATLPLPIAAPTRAPIADQIWDMKYRFKDIDGSPIDVTIEDTWSRIAVALAKAESPAKRKKIKKAFYEALEGFTYLPAGRITSGAGTDRKVTLFNCFVMGTIPDSMGGIFDMLKEAALTMQQGGGIGYDFSTIRPKGELVKGVGSDASGPISFMDVWDAMCRTIMSAGSRRGAMMATMRCDHPDIEDFITAKQDAARLRMFNVSVLATDPFMEAVKADKDWDLVWKGEVKKTVRARDLWDKIMDATYNYAEPGVIFIDRINERNPLAYIENISATNPCVPAGTPILTRDGWWPIEDIVGREIEVWNGVEWSLVTPSITGYDQNLVTVLLNDGRSLTCTTAHRFVMRDGTRVNAEDLEAGMPLHEAEWPVIEGKQAYENAYTQGFFSGDGSVTQKKSSSYIYLYGEKKLLESHLSTPLSRAKYNISGGYEGTDTTQTKVYLRYEKSDFLPKDFVPSCEWDVESRIRWFEGLCDADGSAIHSYNSVSLQVSSKDRDFLSSVQMMLMTLGVKGYLSPMKDCWRMTVSPSDLAVLQGIGFEPKRLDVSNNIPQRRAARFAKVSSIIPAGFAKTVYCFTESKRHMGVFNGILTGQCGEQPLPPYGACLLGSINLVTLISDPFSPSAKMNEEKMEKMVATAVRMMDNVVDVSGFALEAQKKEAEAKRRIGLGITGLADALLMLRLTYGSDEAVAQTEDWMRNIQHAAYRASVELAKEKGPFPLFDADKYLASPTIQDLDQDLQDDIRTHGIRNALLTSIAPTGTISLYAGNVSSGIEPVFAYSYTRKVLQKDGTKTEEEVVDYAVQLYREMFGVEDDEDLPDYFVSAQTLSPNAHVRMQAAAQKWVDSSISKTINCPKDISFEDFKDVYMQAYETGCKGCTTYRPNDVTGSVLEASGGDKAKSEAEARPEGAVPSEASPARLAAPIPRDPVLEGRTYKVKWPQAAHAYYITINDHVLEDGSRIPFEIFINTQNTHDQDMLSALTRMISAVFRRGGNVDFVAEELRQIVNPNGGAWVDGKYVPSLVSMIGHHIFDHMRANGSLGSDTRIAVSGSKQGVLDLEGPGQVADEKEIRGEACPSCGEMSYVSESGCKTCKTCSFSTCG